MLSGDVEDGVKTCAYPLETSWSPHQSPVKTKIMCIKNEKVAAGSLAP
jgi:hypothetical protein